MKKKGIGIIKKIGIGVLAILLMSTIYHYGSKMVINPNTNENQNVIIIDPGHGGNDPGKVGVNDALEKDINLKISFYLKSFLEQNGFEVIMTRTTDEGLYSKTDSNKKATDLKNRVKLINEANPILAVSIHQNSFGQESSKGAQVFYHAKSDEGKIFAEIVQERIKKSIGDGNKRIAKANQDYYMLKNTECPFIFVECGFLSNYEEATILCDEAYQEKMAWAIHLGVINYINQR
jgi:N-acetylmuramoyl-L-alanine amidase